MIDLDHTKWKTVNGCKVEALVHDTFSDEIVALLRQSSGQIIEYHYGHDGRVFKNLDAASPYDLVPIDE